MNPNQTIESTFWAAIFLRTLTAVDPVNGPAYMPAPSAYVAILGTWSVLQAAAGTRFARGASAMSMVLVLTLLVVGGAAGSLMRLMSFITSQSANATGNGPVPAPGPQMPVGPSYAGPASVAPVRSRGTNLTSGQNPRGTAIYG